MVMVVVWFALILWLFRRLRVQHPATFEEIGSPSLIWNNTPRSNLLFVRFLFSSRPSRLNDAAIRRVAIYMRIHIVCYFILFACLLVCVLKLPPRVRAARTQNRPAVPDGFAVATAQPPLISVQAEDDPCMLRFVVDRSYIWLFFAFATVFVLCSVACQFLGRPQLGCLSMPAFVAFLLWTELRSGTRSIRGGELLIRRARGISTR